MARYDEQPGRYSRLSAQQRWQQARREANELPGCEIPLLVKLTAADVRVYPERGMRPRGAGGADAEVDDVWTSYPLVTGRHVSGG